MNMRHRNLSGLRRLSLVALPLLTVLFGVMLTITPAWAASGTTVVFKFQSLTTIANFDNFSSDGCTETLVQVSGTHFGTSLGADVFIGQFDNCTSTLLLEAFGSTNNATLSGNLGLASLSATVPVFDIVSATTFNVSVSMNWTATGPPSHEEGGSHFQTKNFTEIFHFNADVRDASASGTVSVGMTNFTPSPSVFAQIALMKSGSVTITPTPS
jgi:hypothetical protein